MRIVDIRHKGLKRLFRRDDTSKLDVRIVPKLRLQLAVLADLERSDQLRGLPFWKPHELSDGRWSFHVTANWRLTFTIVEARDEIVGLDLEDYH